MFGFSKRLWPFLYLFSIEKNPNSHSLVLGSIKRGPGEGGWVEVKQARWLLSFTMFIRRATILYKSFTFLKDSRGGWIFETHMAVFVSFFYIKKNPYSHSFRSCSAQ